MNWKLLAKCSLAFTLLVAVSMCLLLPLQVINAGSLIPTPSMQTNILTKLDPSWMTRGESNLLDGRLIEQAPTSYEVARFPARTTGQQTFDAIADATILEGYPSVNFGDTVDMWAGYDESLDPYGETARSLVKFDLTSLPPDQTITNATLRVHLVTSWDYPDTSRSISTHRITSNWSEGNVNWNNKPDYSGSYGSRSIVHSAWDWYEFDVTELVTDWYQGTHTNHGIMLRGPEVSGDDSSWRGFGTRESPYVPQLIIEYTSLESTPTETQTLPPTTTQTLTPTTTQTPTPTTTQTPTPIANWIYLPTILKYVGGVPAKTPTPTVTNSPTPTLTESPEQTTETPTPCPQTGNWYGVTDQDEQIVFDVTNETKCLVENLRINVKLECTDLVLYTSIYFDETYQISNGHFKAVDPQATVIGNFNTSTSSSGTWDSLFIYSGHGFCSGSGTWTATR